MTPIKFGTDGWRAIIAQEYTTANVARVAQATATWLKQQTEQPTAVVGFDCRFGGNLFAETTIQVLAANGIKAFYQDTFVTTPMISLATKELGAQVGIVITASHNPASYNGFKIKAHYGGPAVPAVIAEVEALIPDEEVVFEARSLEEIKANGLLELVDIEAIYQQKVEKAFDLEKIEQRGIITAYDAMYGAGQRITPHLLKNVVPLHCEHNPGFDGQAPEPLHKNLLELSNLIAQSTDVDFGFATDGDADRLGVYDSKGQFIDSHHVLLLLIHILHKYNGLNGKVVITFSVSDKVKRLCEHYGLDYEVTQIGFKYICEIMTKEDVLVGGEESGGIAVKGHIPERDGIWDSLVILQYMADSGKSLEEIIQEVYDIVGTFSYRRDDLHLTNAKKLAVIERCKQGTIKQVGTRQVQKVETLDGFKFILDDGSTVMVRPSGTEPVLRVYGEAADEARVNELLKDAQQALLA